MSTVSQSNAMADRDRAIGLACGILSVLLFSSFTLASRLGFSSALHLPDIAALRFGIGGMLLLPVLLRHGLSGIRWRDAAALACFGGLGFALSAYAGFKLAPAAHGAVLLHGSLPLFTFALLRRGGPRQLAGVLMIGLGVLLMAFDSWSHATLLQLAGDGFLLLASLLWSAYGIWARRLGLPPAQGAAIVAVFSMCVFLPVYVLLPGKALFRVGADTILVQALFQGVLIGAVSIFVYTRAVAGLGPATTALFTAAVPCMTTLAAIPLLGEWPSNAAVLGVVVVTIGAVTALGAGRGRPSCR